MMFSDRFDVSDGASLIDAAVWGTIVFVVTAAAAAAAPGLFRWPAVAVAVVLFLIGCFVFLAAFARAVGRSRAETINVAGIWLMSGSTPDVVKRVLLGCAALQAVVGVATAAIRPFTTLAFGILVPMFGLGMAGLWSARYGTFAARALTDRERGAQEAQEASGKDSQASGDSSQRNSDTGDSDG